MRFSPRLLGFSLIELVSVIAIASVLGSLALLSVSGVTRATHVNASASALANLLVQARSEAIAKNTRVQLRVVTEDPGDGATAGRVFSLWVWDRTTNAFKQITNWLRLNEGVSVLDQDAGLFSPNGDVNLLDPSHASPGNRIEEVPFQDRLVKAAFIELNPTGNIRIPATSAPHFYLLLAPVAGASGNAISDRATALKENETNWRRVRIAALTGLVSVESIR